VYCFIPKVACTSWKLWFRRQRGIAASPNDTAEILATHNMHTSQLDYLGYTYSEPQAIRVLTDPSIFKFTFVRNPYARLVSVYLNKHVQGGSPSTGLTGTRYEHVDSIKEIQGYNRGAQFT